MFEHVIIQACGHLGMWSSKTYEHSDMWSSIKRSVWH